MRSTANGYSPRRVLLTSSTAAGLFGLFIVYATVVRPMISAPNLEAPFDPQPPGNVDDKTESDEYSDRARKFLSRHAWTSDATFKSGIGDATVYFQKFEPVDGYKIKFTPFAVIWKQKNGKPGEPPLTIHSDSASLEFERPIDWKNPFENQSPGRVIGGLLQGTVQVTGPNDLTLEGIDFHFSEAAMRIWCDNDVSFTFQKHSGRAHGMQLELIPAEAVGNGDRFAASGVRKVTLLQNVAMNFVTKPDEKKPARPTGKPAPPPDTQDGPVYSRVQSAGSFSFVLESNVATFEDKVSVRAFRPEKSRDIDELLCDLLTLVFSRENESPATSLKPQRPAGDPKNDSFTGLSSNLTFERLSADGKQVILHSPGNKMNASMTRMVYDAKTKIAVLSDPNNVRIVQDTNEMQSPHIELVHDDKGDVTHAKCVGAGWLKSIDPVKNEIRLTAQWQKELRKYPDRESGLDIIELEQQAVFSQPVEQMGLSADFIRLWFEPQQGEKKPKAKTPGSDDRLAELRPRRMRAERNVEMFGRQMNGRTKLLEAWFEDKPARAKRSVNEPPVRQAGAVERKAVVEQAKGTAPARSPSRTESTPSQGSQSTAQKDVATVQPSEELTSDPSSGGPMEISADHVRLLVVQYANEEQPQVAVVETKGNIDVCQYREKNQPPLQMTGDIMQIFNHSDTEQTMVVLGAPAHVRSPQMHIEGSNVNVDRARNVAWVDGPGLLELPVEQDLEGNKLPKPQLLSIWWKKKMTFDGKQAEFLENVVSQLEDSTIHCDAMVATMTKEFSFTQKRQDPNDKIDIRTVKCKGKVEFKMQQYEGNTLSQIRQGELTELSLDQQTGSMTAMGPGYIKSWERGRARRLRLGPPATVKANASSTPQNSDWEYSRIDFAGTMEGNATRRTTTFDDRVEIVYGPVEHYGDTVNPDSGLPERGGWMRCDTLTITQRKIQETDEGYIELLAAGNTEIEGRDYHGRADQVTFDESKGVYTLSGKGNNKATIWRQKSLGGSTQGQNGQIISVNPAKRKILIDGATGAGGNL